MCTDLGMDCGRVDGRSGVWLPAPTTGSGCPSARSRPSGCGCSAASTLHGFALNCDSVLTGFDAIIPCGIRDAGVTSLSRELGRDVTVEEVTPAVTAAVVAALDGELPVTEHDIERVDVRLRRRRDDVLRAHLHYCSVRLTTAPRPAGCDGPGVPSTA